MGFNKRAFKPILFQPDSMSDMGSRVVLPGCKQNKQLRGKKSNTKCVLHMNWNDPKVYEYQYK